MEGERLSDSTHRGFLQKNKYPSGGVADLYVLCPPIFL